MFFTPTHPPTHLLFLSPERVLHLIHNAASSLRDGLHDKPKAYDIARTSGATECDETINAAPKDNGRDVRTSL